MDMKMRYSSCSGSPKKVPLILENPQPLTLHPKLYISLYYPQKGAPNFGKPAFVVQVPCVLQALAPGPRNSKSKEGCLRGLGLRFKGLGFRVLSQEGNGLCFKMQQAFCGLCAINTLIQLQYVEFLGLLFGGSRT